MRRILSAVAYIFATLSSLAALFVAVLGLQALAERHRYGRGLMFTDVELLFGFAVLLGLAALLSWWFGRAIRRSANP